LRLRKNIRKRYIEDIPPQITPEITEHIIHQSYCPRCKKVVEPIVPDAMPGSIIGNQ
jgi:hypothetical protein